MKKGGRILAMMMGIMALDPSLQNQSKIPDPKKKDLNKPKKKSSDKALNAHGSLTEWERKQGIKEFLYDGVIIKARNRKNADRKARNKGLI